MRRQILLLQLFRFFSALRFAAPLLVIYFARVAGSYTLGMSVYSVTSVAQLLFDIPMGALADRYGRTPVMVAGAIAGLLFTACYAIGLNYWWLAAGGALEGLSRALYSGNDMALLHDTLAEAGRIDEYPHALGRVSSAEDIAFAIASLAGGAIAFWSFALAFWLTLLPMSIAMLLCLQLREPRLRERSGHTVWSHTREGLRQFRHNRRLQLLVASYAYGEAVGESSFQFRLAWFNTLWPVWALGLAQSATFVLAAASFYLAGSVLRRISALRVLVVNVLLGRLVSLAALLFPSAASPLLMSLSSLTYGTGEVAMSSLQQQEFTDAQRATMGSISSQVTNVAFALGAVLLGGLADRVGPLRALLVTQLLLLGLLAFYRRLFVAERRAGKAGPR